MKIIADDEGMKVINSLLDISLKAGGIQNLSGVNKILESCEKMPEVSDIKSDKKKDKE